MFERGLDRVPVYFVRRDGSDSTSMMLVFHSKLVASIKSGAFSFSA